MGKLAMAAGRAGLGGCGLHASGDVRGGLGESGRGRLLGSGCGILSDVVLVNSARGIPYPT